MIKNNYKHMCKYFKLMNKFKYFFLVLLCVTTFACSVDTKIQPSQQALVDIENEKLIIKNYKEYEVDESQITLSKIKLDKLFDNPWAIEFIDDNLIVVTEKNGKLSLVDLLNQRVFDIKHKIPTIQYGQGGLLDVLKFEDYLYLSYTITNKDKKYTTAIGRGLFVYPYKELKNFEQIFTAKPFYKDGKHFGSRMLIKDKFLFASIGERGQGSVAQELDSHAGSIIRINLDGSLTENIYKNNLNALPEIFQIGVRNPQGMTLSPYGEIFISNHGAKGGDFIGIVDEGKNYGWDKIGWGGTNYTGFKIGDGEAFLEEFDKPIISWVPSIAPSDILFYKGNEFSNWEGDLLVTSLKYKMLIKLKIENGIITDELIILKDDIGRIRDVDINSKGEIFLITDEFDSHIWKLNRKSDQNISCELTGGETVYDGWSGKDTGANHCNQCRCINGMLACTKMACLGLNKPNSDLSTPGKKYLNERHITQQEVNNLESVVLSNKTDNWIGILGDLGLTDTQVFIESWKGNILLNNNKLDFEVLFFLDSSIDKFIKNQLSTMEAYQGIKFYFINNIAIKCDESDKQACEYLLNLLS